MKISTKNYLKYSILLPSLALIICLAPLASSQYGSLDSEISDLNLKIQNQKKQLETLQQRQQEYQAQIRLKQNDRINLSNQLSILDNRLAQAQLDIEGVNIEIDKTSLEIKKVEIDSANLDKEMEVKKTHIANLLRTMYQQGQVSTLEVLLLNDSLSDFLDQAQYLSDTNTKISESLDELKADKARLDQNTVLLGEKSTELVALKSKLEEKRGNLSYEQENKNYILEETKSSEREYQNLLQKSKREQLQAEAEISNAEQLIRQKMSQKDKVKLSEGNNTIAWPVPKNVIVATFHDSDYPYRKIIGEHPAVDIRAKQGTGITAAADGYVAKVKFDGDKRYAYIMIIHGDGLATVYGHVSAVYVMTDQYVKQGQPIGRSGGMPGGIGSGGFTTGPHLHFEVRLNGLPVNPEKYLP